MASAVGVPAALGGTADEIRARDRLVCGVSEGLRGFSEPDESGAWHGFDVDFCRAVAMAILGDSEKVDYVPLSAPDRFGALADGRIDLLVRNSTWTMSRDVELGLEFVGVNYYDGQGFMVPALYGVVSPLELGGARICVVTGTTTQQNAADYFASEALNVSFVTFVERPAARAAYAEGLCDAYTADRSALAAERSLLAVPDDHVILRDIISKEPLGPVVRDDDADFAALVRWTLFGLINAEERGIDAVAAARAGAAELARLGAPGAALGLAPDWLSRVVTAVGNYGEIFERNLGAATPLQLGRGLNALWNQGGILYAPPMP